MIKTVMLDIDNTLLSFDKYVEYALESGFEKFGIKGYSVDTCRIFHFVNDKLWRGIEDGTLTFEELKKCRFNKVFAELGIEADGPLFETYFRECIHEHAAPIEGSLELLEYLDNKYILCAASNGPDEQQKHRLEIAGMLKHFDYVFTSEAIGMPKPSEEFFSACMNIINEKQDEKMTYAEVMMIGDSITADMTGAITLGMTTCFYNPKKKTVPEGMKVDYEVKSLIEIKNIL